MDKIANASGSNLPQRIEMAAEKPAAPAVAMPDQASAKAADILALSAAIRSQGEEGLPRIDLALAAKAAYETMQLTPSREESIKIGKTALQLFSQRSDSLMARVGLAALEGCQPNSPQALETIKDTLKALKDGGEGSLRKLGALCDDLMNVSLSFWHPQADYPEAAAKGLKMARVLKASSSDPLVRQMASMSLKEIKAAATPEGALQFAQVLFTVGLNNLENNIDGTRGTSIPGEFFTSIRSVKASERQGDFYQPPGFAGIR